MKTKNAAIFLMISSIIWILSDLYWTVQRFTGDSWDYYRYEKPVDLIISTVTIIIPISLLILSIALMNNKTTENTQIIEEKPSSNELTNNLSVGDWLVNFLITIIPLVGFIFIIIWANDDKNKIRKNWAVASIIWTGIIFILSIFLYATIFASLMQQF